MIDLIAEAYKSRLILSSYSLVLGHCVLLNIVQRCIGRRPFLESCIVNFFKIVCKYVLWIRQISLLDVSVQIFIPSMYMTSSMSFIVKHFPNQASTLCSIKTSFPMSGILWIYNTRKTTSLLPDLKYTHGLFSFLKKTNSLTFTSKQIFKPRDYGVNVLLSNEKLLCWIWQKY